MRSSISNSDAPLGTLWWKERCLWTVLTAAVLLAYVGKLPREHETSGVPESRFWMEKMKWNACADVVLAGDSRVHHGLSPAGMQQRLGECRIVNFGFAGNGYSPEYLDAVERVIDPGSRRPTIVLGITPRSLTPKSLAENEFLELRQSQAISIVASWKSHYLAGWLEFFEPWQLQPLLRTLRGASASNVVRESEFHPDGWVATVWTPPQPAMMVESYRYQFRDNRVSEEATARLLERVRHWTKRGIAVVGIRPPTPPEMEEVENTLGGFDERAFVTMFEEAGGRWLRTDGRRYTTYDGCHLDRESAVRYSNDIAVLMRSGHVAHVQNASGRQLR